MKEKEEKIIYKIQNKKVQILFKIGDVVGYIPKLINDVENAWGLVVDVQIFMAEGATRYVVAFPEGLITCTESELAFPSEDSEEQKPGFLKHSSSDKAE